MKKIRNTIGKILCTGILLVASTPAFGILTPSGSIKCTAKGLISGKWEVQLNADTRHVDIQSASGAHYKGTANYFYSPSINEHFYYIALSDSQGVSVRIDLTDGRTIGMCLKENECYLCRE